MVYLLRDALYVLVLTLAMPWLVWRSLRTGRYRHGLRQKLLGLSPSGVRLGAADAACSIWLHGVSVGEIQLLKPMVEELKRELPEAQIWVSTTTQTGMDLAKKLFADSDVQLFYLPLDFSWAVKRTFATIKPNMLVLGELELWPNLIQVAKQRNAVVAVINARLSEKSCQGYQRFSWLTRSTFAALDLVTAQTQTYARRFVDCGSPSSNVKVTGSFKFDNVVFDRGHPEVIKLRKLACISAEHRVFMAGSTQAGEEVAACQAYINARKQYPELKLVVIPRHAERFDAVADELSRFDLRIQRRSELDDSEESSSFPECWDVLLVDSIGELRWWWGIADFALVGGSFGRRGAQNMMEPAAFGAEVAFGPNTSNFKDIVALLLDRDAACQLAGFEEILPWLNEQLLGDDRRGPVAQQVIGEQQGALKRTSNALMQTLHFQRTKDLPSEAEQFRPAA